MICVSSEHGAPAVPDGLTANDALVDALRAGSPFAFAEIVRLFQAKIYRVGYRFTRSHHDAEDIVQETFLRAYRAAPRFRGDAALGTWLHAIATNFARNQYRYWKHRRRHATVSLDAEIGEDGKYTIGDTLIFEEPAAFTRSDREILAVHLGRAMDRLAKRDRQILTRRVASHASYAELAREFNIAVGTVKSRLSRARERLRKRLNLETDQAVGGYLSPSPMRAKKSEGSERAKRNQCPIRGFTK